MTRAILIALIVALVAFLIPQKAGAKAQGDSVGAPKKEQTTGTTKGDPVPATLIPAYYYSVDALKASTTATSTEKMTKKEKREHIKALKAEIKRLEKLIRELKKSV